MDSPVTLVLCTPSGEVLGALDPVPVPDLWWQDVGRIVAAAREAHGIHVTVLRLLGAPTGPRRGGDVTYLAEVDDRPRVALRPWVPVDGVGDPAGDDPHRMPWARPGGPAAELAWANAALEAIGRPRTGAAEQVRAWNLSTLWRLPTAPGVVWLKAVPPFFAHEGAMLGRLRRDAPRSVPDLVAADGYRMLLEHLPGEDQFDATGQTLLDMVTLLVGLQAAWIERVDELLALGAPDWRPDALAPAAADVVERTEGLDTDERRRLDALVDGLPERLADVAACGIPDTLVHGDFHPGNVRGRPGALVLLDWGDCGVGHPLLDQAALLERAGPDDAPRVRAHWARLWRAVVPDSEPERAADLLVPVAALRQAVIYRVFLDNIEASEHVFHADDPLLWLRRAIGAVPVT